jgi:hypothetical protein
MTLPDKKVILWTVIISAVTTMFVVPLIGKFFPKKA